MLSCNGCIILINNNKKLITLKLNYLFTLKNQYNKILSLSYKFKQSISSSECLCVFLGSVHNNNVFRIECKYSYWENRTQHRNGALAS